MACRDGSGRRDALSSTAETLPLKEVLYSASIGNKKAAFYSDFVASSEAL
jgi:hypothetical protein